MSSVFQRAYDYIKAIKTPTWLKVLLGELQVLMFDIAKKAGQNYVAYVEDLIIQAAGMTNLNNKQKFEYVFENARKGGITAVITLKDNELNVLINFLYSQWKKMKGK